MGTAPYYKAESRKAQIFGCLQEVCLPACLHINEYIHGMEETKPMTPRMHKHADGPRKNAAAGYHIVRICRGDRTAEALAADLIRAHTL